MRHKQGLGEKAIILSYSDKWCAVSRKNGTTFIFSSFAR